MDFFEEILNDIKQNGLYRANQTYIPISPTQVLIDGKKYLVMASNNYLGLTYHPNVKKAAIAAINKYGTGSGGARLTTGSHPIYELLEKDIANFKNCEAAVIFNTGYMANVGTISAIMGRNDVIFSDALNHASIIDGCRLSGAKCIVFDHSDMNDLEKCIKNNPCVGKKMIVVDGVFSMDGDIAPLNKLVVIAQKYQAILMVDDAHATGVIGNGRGTAAYFGLEKQVDIQMGTLSKALGAEGAYVAGSKQLIAYLINKARSYIFSTALSPASIAAAKAALHEIIIDSSHIEKLQANSIFMKKKLRENGFNVADNDTAIIPIIIGSAEQTFEVSTKLQAEGIILSAIRPPTVPKGASRLRIAISALHTKSELEIAAQKIAKIIYKVRGDI